MRPHRRVHLTCSHHASGPVWRLTFASSVHGTSQQAMMDSLGVGLGLLASGERTSLAMEKRSKRTPHSAEAAIMGRQSVSYRRAHNCPLDSSEHLL